MFEVRPYTPAQAETWNRFVAQSKNGTFLFDRRYMDYHADRFLDGSLMVYRYNKLYALLPACVKDDTLVSHGGLTYGGLVMNGHCSASGVLEAFAQINTYLRSKGIRRVVYKAVPHIYHRLPAEEDLYALTIVCHARLAIRDISSAVVPSRALKFAESRRSGLRKAMQRGLLLERSSDVQTFWQILNRNLTSKYGVCPVHTAAELQLLISRFPENIQLWLVSDGRETLGGTLLYLTPRVAHTQYISATPEGKACGAIDLLFHQLLTEVLVDFPLVDFGKSTVSDSANLNEQLIFQKEGFGARAVCYDTYEYDL